MSEGCSHDCSSCSEKCSERKIPKEQLNEMSKVKKVIGVVKKRFKKLLSKFKGKKSEV